MDDLKLIKKYYGENMMRLCRELFPTILEIPGLLFKQLDDNFAHSKYLYDDIVNWELKDDFKNFICNEADFKEEQIIRDETPFELLKEAGYILYECKTEEDIQSFKKYYACDEELCSFKGGRLKSCYVFFAVKENVDEIKREDFKEPKRQDEYGTSVIGIQFSRGDINTLSIKNRYNHTVSNPDATFSNNLENIVPGLTKSFERSYNLKINQNCNGSFEIPGYVKANDGKYYKYNYEINNIYYCPDNIIIANFGVKKFEKEKYIIVDYFIIDLVNKKIQLYDHTMGDSFVDGLHDIEKIEIIKDSQSENKILNIFPKDGNLVVIELNKFNQIVGYKNDNVTEIGNDFLSKCRILMDISLKNVINIGDKFLRNVDGPIFISLPSLKKVGNDFCYTRANIEKLEIPELKEIGHNFLANSCIKTLIAPNLEKVGDLFLAYDDDIKTIHCPKLKFAGNMFLAQAMMMEEIVLDGLVSVGDHFLVHNNLITSINLPNLESCGAGFLANNKVLVSVNLPKLKQIESLFLLNANSLLELELPCVEKIGSSFMLNNKSLTTLIMPMINTIGDEFLANNKTFVLRK